MHHHSEDAETRFSWHCGLIIGLDDLKDIFQPKWIYDSIIPWFYNILNCNCERNSGSQNVHPINWGSIRVTRQKCTTQPDWKCDGSLQRIANRSRSGMFVSPNEKLQTTEHNGVC